MRRDPMDSGAKLQSAMEADLDLSAKLAEEGRQRWAEAEAFALREVEAEQAQRTAGRDNALAASEALANVRSGPTRAG